MKYLIYLLFFVLSISSFAQKQELKRTLVLKDLDTDLPIQDATVFLMKFKHIFLSNSEGKVFFVLKSPTSIQITHPNYKDINIRSVSLKNSDNVVYLKSNVSNLDEIVISKKRPEKTFQKIIENSKDKLTIPVRLQIYEREFFKLNGVYTYYNDGLLNFQIPDRDKLYDTNILVEQNRSFGILNDDVANDLLGYNLNNLIGNYYSFKYLNPLLDKKAAEHYNFTIFGTSKGDNYYVMKVQPVDEVKGLLDSYEILYDNKKDLIIEVSSSLSPERIANQPDNSKIGSHNIRSSYFKTIYRIDGDNYYLISSREEIGFDKVGKKESVFIEIKNNFVVTNYSNHFFTHEDKEVFKEKTLFNKKNVILTDFWNISGLVPTEEERIIIEQFVP